MRINIIVCGYESIQKTIKSMDYVFREGMINQIYPPDYVEPWEIINSWLTFQKNEDGDDSCHDPTLKLCKDKECK